MLELGTNLGRNKTTKITQSNETNVNFECNLLDRTLSDDKYREKELKNDIHANELRFGSSSRFNEGNKRKFNDINVNNPTPVTLIGIRGGKKNRNIVRRDLRVLLDSGSSHSMASTRCTKGVKLTQLKKSRTFETAGGDFKTTSEATLNFNLSEFSESKLVNWTFSVFPDSEALGYDMIIGRDLLENLGVIMDFKKSSVNWEGIEIPMKDFQRLKDLKMSHDEVNAILKGSVEPLVTQEATERMVRILDSKYEKANLSNVVASTTHLTDVEKRKLYNLLVKYEDLFDGTLGEWKTDPVDFELVDNAKPHSQRHYPVPHLYKETFRKELERLVKLGVLEPTQSSEWGSPTFIIPKKDNRIRFVSDFRRLNAKIKRKPYPLPRISDTLQQLEGFQYATSLDLNMGYYHIVLSPEAADMCTIITEFGKFKYKRLPMGVSCSPDIFQAKIYELLGDIEGTKAYIDDILVVKKGSFDEHLKQLDTIFQRCQKVGLKINAEKCRFGLNEIDYLGYMVTPEGVKPNPKKIKAIEAMKRPTTTTEVRRLIGMVQYYRDLWPRRSHILEPFTEISSGKKGKPITWTPKLEQAFNDVKAMISKETMLNYPDWSKPFVIHTDASDYQLGAVISQDKKPIAFFSRKLNKAQRNYTTTEKELLSIVECVKEFRNILFGYPITVFSDHKNLVHAATVSQSQRVMRWRMILEEFGPDIRHIAGVDNIVADAISRLPTTATDQTEQRTEAQDLQDRMSVTKLESLVLEDDSEAFPLELSQVRRIQQQELNKRNSKLKRLVEDNKSEYHIKTFENVELVLYKDKIYVPNKLRDKTINWYHHYLCHPGSDRLYHTLNRVCYWKGMAKACISHCQKCPICQRGKKRKRHYGHLPAKVVEHEMVPWHTLHIDLIGPYSKTAKQIQPDGSIQTKEFKLTCMTFVDPATGWFEITEVPSFDIDDVKNGIQTVIDKTSARIGQLFNQTWLTRYPRPKKVVFDNGSEFKKDFIPLLRDFAIKPVPTTIKNPQSNSPVERIHQVIMNMLNTKELDSQPFDYIDPWGEILSSIAWAIRASYHSTHQATPAQMVFGRDMIFNLKSLINWKVVSARKQQIVDKANLRENSKRIDFDYEVGQKAYIVRDKPYRKLDGPKIGPFRITDVYTNGTVRIQKGNVNERINIRRLEPHFE